MGDFDALFALWQFSAVGDSELWQNSCVVLDVTNEEDLGPRRFLITVTVGLVLTFGIFIAQAELTMTVS